MCASSACSSAHLPPYILSVIQGHSMQGHGKYEGWGSAKVLSGADSAAPAQLLSFSIFFSLILVTFAATGCPASTAPHWHLLMKKQHSTHTHRYACSKTHAHTPTLKKKKKKHTHYHIDANPVHLSFRDRLLGYFCCERPLAGNESV